MVGREDDRGRPVGHDLAEAHDDDAGEVRRGELHVVGDGDHRPAGVAVRPDDAPRPARRRRRPGRSSARRGRAPPGPSRGRPASATSFRRDRSRSYGFVARTSVRPTASRLRVTRPGIWSAGRRRLLRAEGDLALDGPLEQLLVGVLEDEPDGRRELGRRCRRSVASPSSRTRPRVGPQEAVEVLARASSCPSRSGRGWRPSRPARSRARRRGRPRSRWDTGGPGPRRRPDGRPLRARRSTAGTVVAAGRRASRRWAASPPAPPRSRPRRTRGPAPAGHVREPDERRRPQADLASPPRQGCAGPVERDRPRRRRGPGSGPSRPSTVGACSAHRIVGAGRGRGRR